MNDQVLMDFVATLDAVRVARKRAEALRKEAKQVELVAENRAASAFLSVHALIPPGLYPIDNHTRAVFVANDWENSRIHTLADIGTVKDV